MSVIDMATNIHNTSVEELTDSQLENTFAEYIMPYIQNYSIVDCMLPKGKEELDKVGLETNIFVYCSMFLGFLITAFTFMWGVI